MLSDTALLSDNTHNLQKLVSAVKQGSEVKGLNMNTSKTKTMVISKENIHSEITVDNLSLEPVELSWPVHNTRWSK